MQDASYNPFQLENSDIKVTTSRVPHGYKVGKRFLPGITDWIKKTFCHENFTSFQLLGQAQTITTSSGEEMPIAGVSGHRMGNMVDRDVVRMVKYYSRFAQLPLQLFSDAHMCHPFVKAIEVYLRTHPKPAVCTNEIKSVHGAWIPVGAQVPVADLELGHGTSIDLIVMAGYDCNGAPVYVAIEIKSGSLGTFESKRDVTRKAAEPHHWLVSPLEGYPADVKTLALIQVYLGVRMFIKTYKQFKMAAGFVLSVNTDGIKLVGYEPFVGVAIKHLVTTVRSKKQEKMDKERAKAVAKLTKDMVKLDRERAAAKKKLEKSRLKKQQLLAKMKQRPKPPIRKVANSSSQRKPRTSSASKQHSMVDVEASSSMHTLPDRISISSVLVPGLPPTPDLMSNFPLTGSSQHIAAINQNIPMGTSIITVTPVTTFTDLIAASAALTERELDKDFERMSTKRKKEAVVPSGQKKVHL